MKRIRKFIRDDKYSHLVRSRFACSKTKAMKSVVQDRDVFARCSRSEGAHVLWIFLRNDFYETFTFEGCGANITVIFFLFFPFLFFTLLEESEGVCSPLEIKRNRKSHRFLHIILCITSAVKTLPRRVHANCVSRRQRNVELTYGSDNFLRHVEEKWLRAACIFEGETWLTAIATELPGCIYDEKALW